MKMDQVHYADVPARIMQDKLFDLLRFQQLSAEYGLTQEGVQILEEVHRRLDEALDAYTALAQSASDPDEPDSLEAIRALRPDGPRRLCQRLPADYASRLRGAFYGRMAGCTLGAALEFHSMEGMEEWARRTTDVYPLEDYWDQLHHPDAPHYITGKKRDLTRAFMDAVPPDDDTIYTLLGLMTMEQYGMDFTQEEMAQIWQRYLPVGPEEPEGMRGCWWGERIMMKNLAAGMSLPEAGLHRNPNMQNIAAWTRADSYGYACPGWPEKAAELAWRDASANHRRNGVYGSMFMAATIAAAFVVDDPMEAVRIGLTEIPRDCLFAEGIRWALEHPCKDYREAHDAVWARYQGMFNGSALTNALHVVMGLDIGRKNFTRTIGQTVAMSGDNDCTGATAGSILGAVIGLEKIEPQWLRPFQGRMHIYLNEHPEYLEIESVCQRLERLAQSFVG